MPDAPSPEALRAAALARGMAHDARNLLSVVVSGVELAQEECRDAHFHQADSVMEALSDARAAALRTAELVQRLAMVLRAPTLPRSEVDVGGLVASTESGLRRQIGPHCRLTLLLPQELLLMEGNATAATEVIRELVTNAVRAEARAITIELTAEEVQADGRCTIVIRVIDDGHGFNLPRVPFDPLDVGVARMEFHRLGLPLVFTLVRSWGGSVELHSAAGSGTTVHLRIPGQQVSDDQ